MGHWGGLLCPILENNADELQTYNFMGAKNTPVCSSWALFICLENFLLSKFHLPKNEASSVLSQFPVKPGCRRDGSLTSQVRMRETSLPWREMKMEMWSRLLPGQRGKGSSGRVLVMSWVAPAEMTVPRGGLKVSAERLDIVIWAWSQVAQS